MKHFLWMEFGDVMNRDRWSSLFWLAVAVLICCGAVKLSLGEAHNPGLGFFPFISGAVLGLLSIIHFLQSGGALKVAGSAALWADRGKALKVLMTVIALLIYAACMEYLGFLLSTILFLGFLLRMIEPQRWPLVIGGSVLVSLVSYGVFDLWLKAELPKGLLLQYFGG
jgi:putative tricarboxylic transport membrane protein